MIYLLIYLIGVFITTFVEYVGGKGALYREGLAMFFGLIWPITWLAKIFIRR
jgi:hypothetical protein